MQIIINRIALLIRDQHRVRNLKWIVALILGAVNVSVFCIWIPARLQISQKIIFVNEIWDRIEKVIFLCVDAGLSLYFIHLVRAKLLANGLMKYMVLFKFTLVMVAFSLSLDVSAFTHRGDVPDLHGVGCSYRNHVTTKWLCVSDPCCVVIHQVPQPVQSQISVLHSDNGTDTFNSTPLSIS